VEWVERFVPKVTFDATAPYHANGGGASVASIEILSRGVFRPNITIGSVVTGYDEETGEPIIEGSDGGGGLGLKLVAVMSAGGAVASIRILNPGSGYTEPPTITLDGDAEAVAVVETDPTSANYGRVIAVTVTAGGEYLPELSFGEPELGGSQAEATCTLDETGGIATVTLTSAGQYYSTVSLSISAPVMSLAPDLFCHWGDETQQCYAWNGVKPGGYADGTPSTHPTSEEYPLPVPEEEGDFTIVLKRAFCDCSPCP
jgi:hypothetical protein